MTVTFGFEPLDLEVILVDGSDFIFTLKANPGWPPGIAIELRFSPTTPRESPSPIIWPASVVGVNASWDRPATDVAAVLDAKAVHVRLLYREADGSRLLWMRGVVRRS